MSRLRVLLSVCAVVAVVLPVLPAQADPVWSSTKVAEGWAVREEGLAVDAKGNARFALMGLNNGARSLAYAECAITCDRPAAWTVTQLPATDAMAPSLRLDGDRPRIVYSDGPYMRYAECELLCSLPVSWTSVQIDPDAPMWMGSGTPEVPEFSFALDSAGRPRVAYEARQGGHVVIRYATCDANCTVAANWTRTDLPEPAGSIVARQPSLALDGTAPRIAYRSSTASRNDIVVTACQSACGDAANWSVTVTHGAPTFTATPFSPRVAARGGTTHLVFVDNGVSPQTIAYQECATACDNAASWSAPVRPHAASAASRYGPGISLNPAGRPRVAHSEGSKHGLLSCDTACASAASWSSLAVDDPGTGGAFVAHATGLHLVGTVWNFQSNALWYKSCLVPFCS